MSHSFSKLSLERMQGVDKRLQDLAFKVIQLALRDYGWFITDTSGSAGFQMEAVNSAGDLWRAQGIDPSSTTARDLMDASDCTYIGDAAHVTDYGQRNRVLAA